MPRPSLTTRTEQLRHVGAAVDTLLELLEGDLRHLPDDERLDALARGVVWALARRYQRAPLAKFVERMRVAADYLEGRQAPASQSPTGERQATTPAESGPVTKRSGQAA